ncbi:Uu.00g043150.m01.CDS01 [Anthostomella pinea]|uniref:Uu.00g043150.m01.CDS01 n=1 Tax=Anthostomella pinea TaxID=933095 RepID=A0AAI8VBE5_9PEZI|nr:Uu.00g043150.m01.CDS01 [Anthostomella pinea]
MLADALNEEPVDANLRMHHISACSHTLGSIKERLRKPEADLAKPDKLTRFQRKLKWPFTSDEMRELLSELDQHQSRIQLALSADTMNGILRLLARQEDSQFAAALLADDVRKTLEIGVRVQVDSRRQTVLDYFMKPEVNPQPSFERSIKLRHPLTGLWIRHYPNVQNWLTIPQSHVWLNGIPGAGKTVLAGTIIEDALRLSNERICAAFFYCDYRNDETKVPSSILGAVACQIALQKGKAFDVLQRYYNALHPSNRLRRKPSIEGLTATITIMSELYDQLLLVVDGVDECIDSTGDVLSALLSISSIDNSSLAILSRDEGNMREILGVEAFTEIEIAATTRDVELYITSELEARRRLRDLTATMKEEILNTREWLATRFALSLRQEINPTLVKDRADGMFRWVTCQLDYLCQLITDRKRRDALKKLPPDLPKSYLRILEGIPKSQSDLVEKVLHLVAFADPQLTIEELCSAVSVSSIDEELDKEDYVPCAEIMRYCSSLLHKSNKDQHLEFAHFSVRQFLKSNFSSDPAISRHKITKSRAQNILATQCLFILQSPNFQRHPLEANEELKDVVSRMADYPVYKYASWWWMRNARNHMSDLQLFNLVKQLFDPQKSGVFISWSVAFHLQLLQHLLFEGAVYLRGLDIGEVEVLLVDTILHGTFKPTHQASLLAIPEICRSLIDSERGYGSYEKLESPLALVLTGPGYLIGRLPGLANKFSYSAVDDAEEEEQSVLVSWAVSGFSKEPGYLEIAAAFIRAGFQFKFGGHDELRLHNVRYTYIKEDNTERAFETLIKALNPLVRTSSDAKDLCSWAWKTAVSLALKVTRDPFLIDTSISLSHESVVENAWYAVNNSDPGMLERALQDPRLKVSASGEGNRSLLTLAIHVGSSKIAKILIDGGCNVSAEDRGHRRPLHLWAKKRNWSGSNQEHIFRLLVKNGASSSVQDVHRKSVWHIAVSNLNALKLLVEAEDISCISEVLSTADNDGYTPVTAALRKQKTDCILILLQHCNGGDAYWQSPEPIFALAAGVGSEAVVKALVSQGAELETLQEDRTTPFIT